MLALAGAHDWQASAERTGDERDDDRQADACGIAMRDAEEQIREQRRDRECQGNSGRQRRQHHVAAGSGVLPGTTPGW